MAWNCSLQIGEFRVQACGLAVGEEFAGFCLWNPDVIQAIRSNDPKILEALNICLDKWEELCAIKWSRDGIFWDVDYMIRAPEKTLNWWECCLHAIERSELAAEHEREAAKEALIELAIHKGMGYSIPIEEIEIDCSGMNTLLAQFDCEEVQFYRSRTQLPRQAGGVYLLWQDNMLDYIGRSKNIYKRLDGRHSVYQQAKHLIGLVPISDNRKRRVVEIALIGALHPAHNNKWSLT